MWEESQPHNLGHTVGWTRLIVSVTTRPVLLRYVDAFRIRQRLFKNQLEFCDAAMTIKRFQGTCRSCRSNDLFLFVLFFGIGQLCFQIMSTWCSKVPLTTKVALTSRSHLQLQRLIESLLKQPNISGCIHSALLIRVRVLGKVKQLLT